MNPLLRIDRILDRITMYRLTFYALAAIIAAAAILGGFGLAPYGPVEILSTAALLFVFCFGFNWIFAKLFDVVPNLESNWITAFILSLIVTPLTEFSVSSIVGIVLIALIAMGSKYVIAWKGKHLFNPAAFAVVVAGFAFGSYASWWVATPYLLPVVLIAGLLVARKLRRLQFVFVFFAAALLTLIAFTLLAGKDPMVQAYKMITLAPLVFLGTIMLTEPLTMPPSKYLRFVYAAIVGFFLVPAVHVGSIYATPELALIVGNVFSYIVSPKGKLRLTLRKRTELASGIHEFEFSAPRALSFKPGQYMEWTLGHARPDTRGNRRYFTLASSPTEGSVRLGVRLFENGSTFKRALLALTPGDTIVAGQLSGEFVLPQNPSQKLAFLAGGIGVTPYRSMVQHLLDTNEARDVTLLYGSRSPDEFAYADIFDAARERFGMKTVRVISDASAAPNWTGAIGYLDADTIAREVPDYRERFFYLSGPQPMVESCKAALASLRVPANHIKTDYFPGLA